MDHRLQGGHVMPAGRSEPQGETSTEIYRWQGHVDAILTEHSRRFDTLNGDVQRAREAAETTATDMAILKTKVAFWSALGGLVGAGVVSGVVAVLTAAGGG